MGAFHFLKSMSREVSVIALSLLLISTLDARAAVTDCIAKGIRQELAAVVKKGKFNVSRDLSMYEEMLGESFVRDLRALKSPKQHWIDAGSGDSFAISDFATAGGPRVTGVTFKSDRVLPADSGVRVLKGRFFERIPASELGRANLITDYYGVMAYTDRPDLVMQRYLDILKDDGAAYIFLGNVGEMNSSKVMLPSGGFLDLEEWIKRIPGVKVEIVTPAQSVLDRFSDINEFQPEFNPRTLRITKLPGQTPKVPTLKPTDAYFDPPLPTPIREFEQVLAP